ncbi:lipopolysaccharide biosynthesis protein [Microbacterium lemovicicum]
MVVEEVADPTSATLTVEEDVATDAGQTKRLGTRNGVLRSVGASAAARFAVMPISAFLGIIVTRLLIENYGEATYAQYILLVSVGALIPFADLGVGAAIMNAAAGAKNPRTDAHLRSVLVACIRVLASSAIVIILVAVAIYALGAWPALLGEGLTPSTGGLAATLCLVVFGFSVLTSFGQRIMIALGLNSTVILLQVLQTPIVLLVLWTVISTGGSGGYIAVVSYLATFLIGIVVLIIAARKIRPAVGRAMREAVTPGVRGARVFDTAWPQLVMMVALPLAMASDRLVLSHLSTLQALTEYSLAAQMFMPLYGAVAAAGMSLWPVFARARQTGQRSPVSPFAMSAAFAGFGLVAASVMMLLSGWLAEIASGGVISLGWPILVMFVIYVTVQAAKYPFGAFLTDAKGLRFQAYCVLLLLPINLGLTLLLTPLLGAPGPLIGSVIGVVLCQMIPNAIMVRRRLKGTEAPR